MPDVEYVLCVHKVRKHASSWELGRNLGEGTPCLTGGTFWPQKVENNSEKDEWFRII